MSWLAKGPSGMADFTSTSVETPPLLTPLTSEKRNESWDVLDRPHNAAATAHSLVRLQSVQKTVRTLQLDHTESSWAIVSYVVAFLLLIVIPVCKLLFVKSSTDIPRRQLVFQPVVVAVGVSRSVVSFVFLSQAIRRHGLQGFLLLDSVAEEVAQIRKDYDTVIELGSQMLVKLFVPSFLIYIGQSLWLYSVVELRPLPFGSQNSYVDLAVVIIMTCLSWMFQTSTYLYACVLFWKVCKLQELKMRQYYEMLLQGLEAEYYLLEYDRIKKDLSSTSHRFRHFLAFTGVISISGALISMYEVVNSFNDGVALCSWGELIVLTIVNLTGAWLCLRCASKIAHLHRRIVRRAASVHANQTLKSSLAVRSSSLPKGSVQYSPLAKISEDGIVNASLERIEDHFLRQEAWSRRAAVVEFLANSVVGISVYGFILDRFFVHTSVGAILTTTWFILGRSLQG